MLTAMMALFNTVLLLVLLVWLFDREDDLPRRARVLPFRPRTSWRRYGGAASTVPPRSAGPSHSRPGHAA